MEDRIFEPWAWRTQTLAKRFPERTPRPGASHMLIYTTFGGRSIIIRSRSPSSSLHLSWFWSTSWTWTFWSPLLAVATDEAIDLVLPFILTFPWLYGSSRGIMAALILWFNDHRSFHNYSILEEPQKVDKITRKRTRNASLLRINGIFLSCRDFSKIKGFSSLSSC